MSGLNKEVTHPLVRKGKAMTVYQLQSDTWKSSKNRFPDVINDIENLAYFSLRYPSSSRTEAYRFYPEITTLVPQIYIGFVIKSTIDMTPLLHEGFFNSRVYLDLFSSLHRDRGSNIKIHKKITDGRKEYTATLNTPLPGCDIVSEDYAVEFLEEDVFENKFDPTQLKTRYQSTLLEFRAFPLYHPKETTKIIDEDPTRLLVTAKIYDLSLSAIRLLSKTGSNLSEHKKILLSKKAALIEQLNSISDELSGYSEVQIGDKVSESQAEIERIKNLPIIY